MSKQNPLIADTANTKSVLERANPQEDHRCRLYAFAVWTKKLVLPLLDEALQHEVLFGRLYRKHNTDCPKNSDHSPLYENLSDYDEHTHPHTQTPIG